MIVFLLLLAVIAPIVVVQPLHDDVVMPKLVTTAAFTGGALVWGAIILARDRWPAGRWPATLWVPVVVFVAVNILAAAFAFDWRWSLMGEFQRYQGLATTLLYVVLLAVTAVAVRTTRDLRWLLLALFLGALGTAIYALIQKAGLDWYEWAGQAAGRPNATLGQPNAFAAYLVAVISTCAFLVLFARERWQQAAFGGGLVVMLFALLFTQSRAGLLAATPVVVTIWSAAAILWFVFYRKGMQPRGVHVAAAGLPAVGVALLALGIGALFIAVLPQGRAALGEAAGRAGSTGEFQSEDVGGRLSLWRLGARMWVDRPLLGHGQDAFTPLFADYRDRPDLAGIGTGAVEPESAHNFFIDLAVGTGALGLLSFLALVGAVLWHAGRRALATDDASLRVALVALGAGVAGYLTAVLFGFSEAMTTWVLWLLLGAMVGLLARVPSARDATADRPLGAQALGAGVAAILLAVLGVATLGWAASLTAADLAAGQAILALGRGDSDAAAHLANRAVTLNPVNKTYLVQKAQLDKNVGNPATDRHASLEQSIETYHTLMRRFDPAAYDVLGLATTTLELAQSRGESPEPAYALMEQAAMLDFYNFPLRDFVAKIYERDGLNDRAELHRVEIYCWHVVCD
ncbi:MAG: O-antigen ligase family protein [Dehalococcoidia bacterium]|nr:O-antigen ligase family protein [Dehalococcoidia bacterium]